MFATLRTTCSRCMPRGSRPRTAVRGARGTPGAHAPCAFAIYSENRGYQAQPRGGCCRGCDGVRRSKRVGGHAACAAAAHGERAGGSGRCDGEPSRGRCAPARDASLQERVATRPRNLLWGAKWAGGVAEGRRQPYPSSTSGSRCRQATCSSTDERPQANDRGVEHREGGDPSTAHKSPGRTTFGNSSWPSRCSAVGRPSTLRYPT